MAKEKETKPKDAGAALFDLSLEKGQEGVIDTWPEWCKLRHNEARNSMPAVDPNDLFGSGNGASQAYHMGLIMVHGAGHPLYAKLTREERKAMAEFLDACKRIFQRRDNGGIYAKFQARIAATR